MMEMLRQTSQTRNYEIASLAMTLFSADIISPSSLFFKKREVGSKNSIRLKYPFFYRTGYNIE